MVSPRRDERDGIDMQNVWTKNGQILSRLSDRTYPRRDKDWFFGRHIRTVAGCECGVRDVLCV